MDCSDGPATLRTLPEDITLEEAMAEEHNMLHRLTYWQKRCDLLDYLSDHRADIEAVVSHHLNLNKNGACFLAPISEWIHGSFNICLPINIQSRSSGPGKRVLVRFPLPFKIGEETFPGNADEKLRCEAATYIWIQENCPDVPIPQLLGFAFSGNQCVSYVKPSIDYSLLTIKFHSLQHLGEPHGTLDLKNISGGNYVLCLAMRPSVDMSANVNRPI